MKINNEFQTRENLLAPKWLNLSKFACTGKWPRLLTSGGTGKWLHLLTFAGVISLSLTASVMAEETNPYKMEAGVDYEVDLDGDGNTEFLSFLSYTDEGERENGEYYSEAVLDFFLNGDPFWSVRDEEWSYSWRVNYFELEDGKTYLMAASTSDNDWTNQVLLLGMDDESDSITTLADLTVMTRQTDSLADNSLGQWARAYEVYSTEGNSVTITWLTTLMHTGILHVPITYTITDDMVTMQDLPFSLDEEATWTAWRAFDVQVSPEDNSIAYSVSPDEVVHLTEYTVHNEKAYVKCVNEQGQEGWCLEPDEMYGQVSEDGMSYLGGYFREALFAG